MDGMKFMGQDLFRSIWFAYASLQHFVGDMSCSSCGTAPETVIWDGITLAYGKKHLLPSLRPPTTVHPQSAVRKNTVYRPHQQLLRDPVLRKHVREALRGPSVTRLMETANATLVTSTTMPDTVPSPIPSTNLDPLSSPLPSASPVANPFLLPAATPTQTAPSSPGDITLPKIPSMPSTPRRTSQISQPTTPATPATPSKTLLRHVSHVESHLEHLKQCVAALKSECPALSTLFERYLGPGAYVKGQTCPAAWKTFFQQVILHCSCFCTTSEHICRWLPRSRYSSL